MNSNERLPQIMTVVASGLDRPGGASFIDGTLLMFASNRPDAKHDLYIARVSGNGFAPAEPLQGAVNTPGADEFDAAFLADGSSIVFSRSTNVENDPIELYFATRGPAGTMPGRDCRTR